MEKNFILNRRTVLGGAAALGTVGVLAACVVQGLQGNHPGCKPWAPMPRSFMTLVRQLYLS